METTERIVESYVRHVRGWATIPNIKCEGQFEIDLLAIDPIKLERYHIESGVSIAAGFSRLTNKPFSDADLKIRVKQASQRRTLGYFVERKFGSAQILQTLGKYGFAQGAYHRVIVSWGWDLEVEQECLERGIQLWDFRQVIIEIADACESKHTYFTDDIVRTIHLFDKAMSEQDRLKKA